jgi:hypothetical protein
VVWNLAASVLMATLTTVVSRIDMIVPSTTTPATTSSARSIGACSVALPARGSGSVGCRSWVRSSSTTPQS